MGGGTYTGETEADQLARRIIANATRNQARRSDPAWQGQQFVAHFQKVAQAATDLIDAVNVEIEARESGDHYAPRISDRKLHREAIDFAETALATLDALKETQALARKVVGERGDLARFDAKELVAIRENALQPVFFDPTRSGSKILQLPLFAAVWSGVGKLELDSEDKRLPALRAIDHITTPEVRTYLTKEIDAQLRQSTGKTAAASR